MPIVEVEQGTAEWLQMRVGCVSASRVADVLAKLKTKDAEAKTRQDYKSALVCERLTGRPSDNYVSPAMEWGIENECLAKAAYEVETGNDVEPAGLAMHESIKWLVASPDGLVAHDGLIECKCPNTTTHINYILSGVVPAEYQAQMLCQMACTGRQWCDFVSYDPRLPKRLQLFVRRFPRDDQRIAEMEAEVVKFLAEVEELMASLESKAAA